MIKLKFVKLPSVCCGLDRNNKKVFTSLNCLMSAQQSMEKFKEFNDPPGLVLAFVANFVFQTNRCTDRLLYVRTLWPPEDRGLMEKRVHVKYLIF